MTLTPELLLTAYSQGIFPMADGPGQISWYSPIHGRYYLWIDYTLPDPSPDIFIPGILRFGLTLRSST